MNILSFEILISIRYIIILFFLIIIIFLIILNSYSKIIKNKNDSIKNLIGCSLYILNEIKYNSNILNLNLTDVANIQILISKYFILNNADLKLLNYLCDKISKDSKIDFKEKYQHVKNSRALNKLI